MKNSTISTLAAILVLVSSCGFNESTTTIKRHDADLSEHPPIPRKVTKPDSLPCGFPNPIPGEYDTIISADGGYQRFRWFDLIQSAEGGSLFVRFSVDGYRHDNIPVICGTFSNIHGCGYDGTSYPTDGYQMYGSFISATEARGYFANLYGCEVNRQYDFNVTLRPDAGR